MKSYFMFVKSNDDILVWILHTLDFIFETLEFFLYFIKMFVVLVKGKDLDHE